MKFTEPNDLYRALSGSVILYKKEPVYVQTNELKVELFHIGERFNIEPEPFLILDGRANNTWEVPKLGFFPSLSGGCLFYLTRGSRRQWVVGLNDKNVTCYNIKKNQVTEREVDLFTPFGYSLLCKDYDFDKAIANGGGLSEEFGVLDKILFHKTVPIGRVVSSSRVDVNIGYLNSIIHEDLRNIGFKLIGETNEDF